jgi:hypothetical protein
MQFPCQLHPATGMYSFFYVLRVTQTLVLLCLLQMRASSTTTWFTAIGHDCSYVVCPCLQSSDKHPSYLHTFIRVQNAQWSSNIWLLLLRHSSTHLLTTQSVSVRFHSIFQSEFSTECDLVLPVSISSILSFPQGHSVAAYVFFLVLSSLLSFPPSHIKQKHSCRRLLTCPRFKQCHVQC